MSWFSAGLAAVSGAIKAWNHERGKADRKENVQLGMDLARAKDDREAAKAALRAARVLAKQGDDDEIDQTARELARLAAR